ncbi:hypothetical protein KFK09_016350 [Dendrobium nobile]|uniref:KTI12-like protein n=1 Tax=Dendrobium nobile TaxID=94219 RepID=A0A8T3B4I5_DENNO|nr:hypothetical protein KFK09_016350 [Dendrobium nobile]
MALVVICGQPCSGKSTIARCLVWALEAVEPKPKVRIIDESSFHLGRNQSYADMTAEKNLRGILRSEVDRSLSKDNIIIVDSLNNIKLYCDTGENYCKEWNNKRGENEESSYDPKIFDDLVSRFERPDRRNRWDCPLFELVPSSEGIEQSSPVIADAVSYLTRKVDSRTRDIRVLQPTIATQNVRATEANSLYELDKATQEVINAIVEAQSQALGGSLNKVSIGQHYPTISFSNYCLDYQAHVNVERRVGLPELKSLRRTFIKLTGQTSLSGRPPPSDAESAKRMFVDYLNREIGTS